jgi:hypothetical protein
LKLESQGQHTHDRFGLGAAGPAARPTDSHALADDLRAATESPLPGVVAQHDAVAWYVVLLFGEVTARMERHSEHWQEV